MVQGEGGMGRGPWILAVLVLTGVLIAQANRLGTIADQNGALQAEVEAAQTRVEGATGLLRKAEASLALQEARVMELEAYLLADALIPVPPSGYPRSVAPGEPASISAEALNHRIRILTLGDPDLIDPSAEGGMVVFFDELL